MALHETVMADAYHSIKAGLDVFKQPLPGAAADAPNKAAALTAAAERVKTEASKSEALAAASAACCCCHILMHAQGMQQCNLGMAASNPGVGASVAAALMHARSQPAVLWRRIAV